MTNILVSDFLTGLLIFLRLVGFFFTAPVFSHQALPNITKLFLSLFITYIIFFMIDDFRFNYEEGLLALSIYGIKELITGMIIGFMLNFIFYGISYAGVLIGFDIGLSMAQAFDPNSDADTNLVGQILFITSLLIFILINGHHYVVQAMAYSFKLVPIGKFTLNNEVFSLLIKYSAGIFILAVKIASPIMVSFFLVNIASGVIARVIPQMNVFFVLVPSKIMIGLFLIASVLPIYVYVIKNLLVDYENKLLNLVKAMGS